MKINKISIVIPILNEEKNLNRLVKQIKKTTNKLKLKKFELILIDDDSKDKSELLLASLAKKNKFLKYYIRKGLKSDLSKSCILGFEKSKYPNILVMDGDLQHPPRYIEHMAQKFFSNKVDVVVGSRNLFHQRDPGLSLLRYISSIAIIYVINFFLENKTSDPLSGFFIFKKKIFLKNKKRLFGKGYKILLDIIHSSAEKISILDQNIYFDSRKKGKSKMSIYVLVQLFNFLFRSFVFKWMK